MRTQRPGSFPKCRHCFRHHLVAVEPCLGSGVRHAKVGVGRLRLARCRYRAAGGYRAGGRIAARRSDRPPQGDGAATPSSMSSDSSTASGFRAMVQRRVFAATSGFERPCSQFRSVVRSSHTSRRMPPERASCDPGLREHLSAAAHEPSRSRLRTTVHSSVPTGRRRKEPSRTPCRDRPSP